MAKYHELTVKQIQVLRDEMTRKVEEIVLEFEQETGLSVDGFEYQGSGGLAPIIISPI